MHIQYTKKIHSIEPWIVYIKDFKNVINIFLR